MQRLFSNAKGELNAICKHKVQLLQPLQFLKLSCALIFDFETLRKLQVFKICCALIALRFQFFFLLVIQLYTLNEILFHFDHNIDKCQASTFSLSEIAKNALFELCLVILVAKVKLHFDLEPKCRFAIAKLKSKLIAKVALCFKNKKN